MDDTSGKSAEAVEPADVDLPGRIDRDAGGAIVAAAADVGGVKQRVAGGVQLEHERVHASAVHRLDGVRNRKIDGFGPARRVQIAGRVDGQSGDGAHRGSAHVRGVRNHRIDDQRQGRVVVAQVERDGIAGNKAVAGANGMADAIRFLVRHGRLFAQFGVASMDDQVAMSIDEYAAGIGIFPANLARIGSGRDQEFRLQLGPASRVIHVDAGI